jgi:succinate dehydrogenase / fumarate reductase cytochrome b subunit
MNWWQRLYGASVGKKVLMAVSGIFFFLFVIVHMLGNLQVYLGPKALNAYAAFLHSAPALLWTARIILLVLLLLHLLSYVQLWLQKRRARPIPYAYGRTNVSGTVSSRTMYWTGPILLAFIIFHLLHFTTGHVHPNFTNDVYANFIVGFRQVPVSIFYIVAMGALGYHLMHGAWSLFQTLGLRPVLDRPLKGVTLGLTGIVVLGNISMPVAVMAGLIGKGY